MKTLVLVAMWLAGTAAAVGVAWAGVSVVDDHVIDPAPAVEFETTAAPSLTPGDDPGSSAPEVAAPAPDNTASSATGSDATAPASPSPVATAEPTEPSAAQPTPEPPSGPAAMPATPTPDAASAPTPAADPPPPPAPASTTQTFNLTGGTTAVSFSSAGVQVLWATPNPGFDVSIEPESPGFKVEFRADHHRSRIDVWWSGGPVHSIREEPQG